MTDKQQKPGAVTEFSPRAGTADTPESEPDNASPDDAGVVSSATMEALTLIDDHEEEVDIGGKKERRRGIYILPNLFTTGALFSGFYAIIASMHGNFEAAAVAVFAAMLMDGLDGRVARLTNTQSKFGAEYDSLADMVSFGVAPALVVFNWGLGELGKFGWTCAFIYVACAALRLARFNTQIETADKNYFSGLASPSAAAVIGGVVWVCNEEGWSGAALPMELSVIAGLLTGLVGFLMILNVPYYSFKGLDLRGRVPFVVIFLIVLGFGVVMMDPARVLLAAFMIYALSGPVTAVIRLLRRRRSTA